MIWSLAWATVSVQEGGLTHGEGSLQTRQSNRRRSSTLAGWLGLNLQSSSGNARLGAEITGSIGIRAPASPVSQTPILPNPGQSAFEDDLRDCLRGGVGQRKRDVSCAEPRRKLGRLTMEGDGGPASGLPGHLDVAPAHAMVPAGAERFHGRFLGGKAGSITFDAGGCGLGIASFAFGEHTPKESVAMTRDGLRDARNFRDVDTGADDHERLR